VRRLKYDNHRDAVADLAAAIASQAAPDVDLVTWVPASRRRARRRGFDQGEVLGRAVARSLGVASRRLLVRVGGAGQTGAGRAERLDGPGLVLRDRGALVDDAVVLVVDDVRTTGASLAAAARALRAGGAVRVDGATLAATPIGAPISGATMPRSNAGDREGSGRADPCERETHQRLGT
jgi:predicted amidophosphoribosyltransferase